MFEDPRGTSCHQRHWMLQVRPSGLNEQPLIAWQIWEAQAMQDHWQSLLNRAFTMTRHRLLPLMVVTAVIIGLWAGYSLSARGMAESDLVTVLRFPGSLWLKSLKCIVLPLIICSMITSMVTLRLLPDPKRVGLVFVLYVGTTLVAVIEGCLVSHYILGPSLQQALPGQETAESDSSMKPINQVDLALNVFDQLVPSNIFKDAAEGRLLPVIVASIIIGSLLPPYREDGRRSTTLEVVEELGAIVQKVVQFIISLTPIGVGSLVLGSAAAFDIEKVGGNVGVFVGVVAGGLAVHTFVVYPLLLMAFAQRNPLRYYGNLVSALLAAMGMASSAGALPLSIEVATEKNGIRPDIAKFVLSLGATINMDGTSFYLICGTFFLGVLEGVTFDARKYVTMSIMATLCSIGSAPVPSASLVFLATIMSAVGVPMTDSFGLVVAVDWLLDRFRTVTNVTGDHVATAIMDKVTMPPKEVFVDIDDDPNARV
eukprot:TRINITY_DN10294_c0_g1_i3.p1 TRINITY_DN10294_c0_g1~~TRINITY_DN10294_c0_g1_i3.p1  ORF type:complete len:483 (+),score=89.89 TRINITY_DN10294_c0_g1_i3:325-1773(+)